MRVILIQHPEEPLLDHLLFDFRSMVRHLVRVALTENHCSPVALRKETKEWFARSWRSRYATHWHHSACSTAVGIARSYWRLKRQRAKAHLSEPSLPYPHRLMARVDRGLTRIKNGELVVTVRPRIYLRFPITDAKKHKKWGEWSKQPLGEVTLLPRHVVLPFRVPERQPAQAPTSVGVDLNLNFASFLSDDGAVGTVDLASLSRIQRDGQKRRENIQKAVPTNLRKQRRVMGRCRWRQRNRTLDHVRQKVAPAIVEVARSRNIIFEDLSAKEQMVVGGRSKDLRRKLSRWAVGLIQRETEQRSPAVVARVNPRGTSSECLRCGGSISHPSWRVSRCGTCGDFDRDSMASGIIVLRGRNLLGVPPLDATARASLAELARIAPQGPTLGNVEAMTPGTATNPYVE